ncbi:hypothetical protein ACJMK2_007601 [Sinanodonta woodiana]|uniref:Endoglucanase n=1 Tax=Sinanodonta woodiana TaxID=1069815 RepID=A0ABD3VJ10_SINWO
MFGNSLKIYILLCIFKSTLVILSVLCVVLSCASADQTVQMKLLQHWDNNFEGQFSFPLQTNIVGWELKMNFSVSVSNIQQWDGDWYYQSPDGRYYVLLNKDTKGLHAAGTTLTVRMMGVFSGNTAPSATGTLVDLSGDSQTVPPVHVPNSMQHTQYNYAEVLEKSILFYEAQRSGKLPANNRIPWRGDSALHDQGDNGVDLTGGWYDAGDHVKFGLPMAYSVTMLAWGLLEWKQAYEQSGQLQYMLDSIKWPLDYLLKCHTAEHELYVQVGDGGPDHGYWGRPENMTMARPSFKITESKPGSDVAGETAAAMAAGYLVFTSVSKSNDYVDDLCWAGIWLYQATKEAKYLHDAETHYQPGSAWGLSWDDKQAGCFALLYKFTHNNTYKEDIVQTFHDWMPGGTIPYSPGGLAFRLQWGALRYAVNMGLIALMAADLGISPKQYRCWAISQFHYALGSNPQNRSYVVGFGNNPPQRPHHRSSSCPMIPAPCGWDEQTNTGPNPHVLYGALVGGPDQNDVYVDDRKDYVKNEVACDYNAAFQSGIAGLLELAIRNQLPDCQH